MTINQGFDNVYLDSFSRFIAMQCVGSRIIFFVQRFWIHIILFLQSLNVFIRRKNGVEVFKENLKTLDFFFLIRIQHTGVYMIYVNVVIIYVYSYDLHQTNAWQLLYSCILLYVFLQRCKSTLKIFHTISENIVDNQHLKFFISSLKTYTF